MSDTPGRRSAGVIHWFQNHARSVLFLMLMLALGGAASAFNLPVALFPQVSFPRVVVDFDAGDRPAERMAVDVTYPAEEAVRSIPGVRHIRSTTSRGSAEISVDFDWGQDMTAGLLQVQSEINKVLPSLPAGTTFEVERRDPTVFPVIAYSITSDAHSLVELRDLAQLQLRPLLSTVHGVSKVDVQGGQVEEYRVVVDPTKLSAFHMTLGDVSTVLAGANVQDAVGKLEDHDKLYLLIADTHMQGPDEISATILRTGANGIVRVADIATVVLESVPDWTRVTADGHDAVLFQVFQQPDANTVQIARDIRAKLKEFEPRKPKGVNIANWYDQSDLIVASAKSVRDAVLIGIGLAAVVLLIFLRNFRITLIATLVVPAALASTILMLYAFGMSFNIMTLGGMAAAVGLIIDDAIVMVEHIVRRFHGGEANAKSRVTAAVAEFTGPLAGSSASTVIIFTPLAFLSGVTGAFFKALSLTMAASLVISFLIAWLAVPALAANMLTAKGARGDEHGGTTHLFHNMYEWIMRPVLRFPFLIILLLAPLLIAGYLCYERLGSGFMPSMDEGGFILDYNSEPGTSLAETDRLLRQVESILRSVPEVETYSRRTGLQLGGGLTEPNTGDFFIRLKPFPRRSIDEVMKDVRTHVQKEVPGLDIETAQLMEDLISDLTSVPQPIEIKIFSDDQATLVAVAPKVKDAIDKIPNVVDTKNGINPAGDAIYLQIDRVKAGLEGMDADDISKALTDALSGNVATQFQKGPKMIGVRVWLPKTTRAADRDMDQLQLRAPDGHVFPFSRIATRLNVTGQPEINRDDLKRMVAVTGRIEGRDLGSVIVDVKKALQQPDLFPPGVYYTIGGLYEQQQIAFRGLMIVIGAAIILVFLLLLFLYNSFRVAIAMLSIPLFAMGAVFIGLWLTGTELNITAMMGMTMIVGIVTEVAIFYYSEFHDLPADMQPIDRLILAGKNRMRPIAMTTIAAILALSPLALGLGQGSAMQQPLAIAIISGLLVQLPLVLLVLPALLKLFGSRKTS